MSSLHQKMIELGVETSRSLILRQDKIWAKYSHDKIDIGWVLCPVGVILIRLRRRRISQVHSGDSSPPI